jgi:hypothetical protein
MAGFLSENRPIRTLREVMDRLKETYCGNIGFEVWGGGGRRGKGQHVKGGGRGRDGVFRSTAGFVGF